MGRIPEQRGGPEHMRWFWSLFGMFGKPVLRSGPTGGDDRGCQGAIRGGLGGSGWRAQSWPSGSGRRPPAQSIASTPSLSASSVHSRASLRRSSRRRGSPTEAASWRQFLACSSYSFFNPVIIVVATLAGHAGT